MLGLGFRVGTSHCGLASPPCSIFLLKGKLLKPLTLGKTLKPKHLVVLFVCLGAPNRSPVLGLRLLGEYCLATPGVRFRV